MEEREAIERLKEEVLNDVLGMDDLGLWEPLSTLNGWYPEDDDKERREAVAEQALRDLFEAGLITLYRMPWAAQDRTAGVPIRKDEIEAELRAAWWRELPLPSSEVWITATKDAPRIARRNVTPSE